MFDLGAAWDERGPPKYLGISMYLTDAAGEKSGPHGDALRRALVDTDERVGRLLALYDDAGIFDSTLFVVTADHGMELQDVARAGNPTANVNAVATDAVMPSRGFVYLPY